MPVQFIQGRTEEFGGGDFLFFRFGRSLEFAVIYGNKDHKAPVTVFSKGTDVVGLRKADNGTEFPVLSRSISVYRLTKLIEIEHMNDDANTNPNSSNNSTLTASHSEDQKEVSKGKKVHKVCNLHAAWTLSKMRRGITDSGMEWGFKLAARNLSYEQEGEKEPPSSLKEGSRGSGFLDLVEFSFRITVEKNEIAVSFDRYSSEGEVTGENKKMDTQNFMMDMKMDHRIHGWDTSPGNRKPMLLLVFDLHMGRTFDPRMIREVHSGMKNRLYDGSSIRVRGEQSDVEIYKEGEEEEKVDLNIMEDGRLGLWRGNNLLTSLYWTTAMITSDDTDARSPRARVYIRNSSLIGPFSELWRMPHINGKIGLGLELHGAYVYPASQRIHHDPGISTVGVEIRTPMDNEDGDNGDSNWSPGQVVGSEGTFSLFILMVGVAVLVAISVLVSLSRRKEGGDEEIRAAEEEEVFVVRSRKRDWDRLKI